MAAQIDSSLPSGNAKSGKNKPIGDQTTGIVRAIDNESATPKDDEYIQVSSLESVSHATSKSVNTPEQPSDPTSENNVSLDQLVLNNLKQQQGVEKIEEVSDEHIVLQPASRHDPSPAHFESNVPVLEPAFVNETSIANQSSRLSRKKALLAGLLIIVLFVVASIIVGPLSNSIKLVIQPAQEYSFLKAEIDRLIKKIETAEAALASSRASLATELEADQSNTSKRYWQLLSSDYLFSADAVGPTEAEYALAQSLISEKRLAQGLMSLRLVDQSSRYRLEQFSVGGDIFQAKTNAADAYRQWRKVKQNYGLENPIYVSYAELSEADANASEVSADFKLATDYWQLAEVLWLRSYDAVQPQIRQIQDNQRVAKLAAAKQLEAQRLAAELAEQERQAALAAEIEAKRLAEIAEAQRLAELAAIEAEKRKQEELKRQKLVVLAVGNMIDVPAGQFQMGCDGGENCPVDQQPSRMVSIQPFRIGETEVTFEQWDACVALGGCSHKPKDEGWGRGQRPVVNVSFEDVTAQFIPMLNQYTGRTFRLPTEAEWEYVASGGRETRFAWGDELGVGRANCSGCGSSFDNKGTNEVKLFPANLFGVYGMHGNAMEWTQDCWKSNYQGLPSSGAAYLGTPDKDEIWVFNECRKRVLRGGSWFFPPSFIEARHRNWNPVDIRSSSFGFRLVEDI